MSDALSRGGWLLGRETGIGLEGPPFQWDGYDRGFSTESNRKDHILLLGKQWFAFVCLVLSFWRVFFFAEKGKKNMYIEKKKKKFFFDVLCDSTITGKVHLIGLYCLILSA